jgi:hypothetical protein
MSNLWRDEREARVRGRDLVDAPSPAPRFDDPSQNNRVYGALEAIAATLLDRLPRAIFPTAQRFLTVLSSNQALRVVLLINVLVTRGLAGRGKT